MKRATLMLAALALLLGGVGQARAGFFSGTAQIIGTVYDSFFPTYISDGPNNGTPVSASASGSATGELASITWSGQANVLLVPPPGLSEGVTWELKTHAQMSFQFPSGSPPQIQDFGSEATWQDVLVLSNTNPSLVGNTLRLNFS
jgi:hypothetical protein